LLKLPQIPDDCTGNCHLFYVVVATAEIRDALLDHLAVHGVQAVFHYVPLHSSPMGTTFGYGQGDLPVTEGISGRLLRLPIYYEISDEEQDRVVELIRSFFGARRGTGHHFATVGDRLQLMPESHDAHAG
jgi:dTDP-4-amino-4,6-dideoxygalactose transaminase